MSDEHTQFLVLARQAILQGREFEQVAEKWRLEAEQAIRDASAMKAEGRERAKTRERTMLPGHPRAHDVHTNAYKDVQDAKGDAVLWLSWAQTYAALAQMKFAKATALYARAEALRVGT